MKGKEKCKALKEIRRQIAEENDIPYVVSQCTHQGDCRGTCPKCESELRYLERELAVRQGLGKAVAVVGISASVCGTLTACSPVDTIRDALGIGVAETAGDIALPEEETDGGLEESPGAGQDGSEELSEGVPENRDTALPEGESQGMDEALAGALPIPEEPEEDLVMGEILPSRDWQEDPGMEPEGDIALPEEGLDCSAESVPPPGETAP